MDASGEGNKGYSRSYSYDRIGNMTYKSDVGTYVYNYNARLYDPELGRFISADSIVPEPGSLQTFNRYSYCVNNPLIYVDPGGNFPWVAFAAAMFIGAASEAAFAAINGGDVLAGAIKGAFSAGVMFVTGVYLGGTGVIAITEAGQEVVKNLPAAVAAHMTAGATTGAFDTLVSGGDLGQNIMVSAISAGMAKGLGNYLPGGLTGNSCVDFGIGLAGHAAIGGISGGGTATLFGGNFGEGFEQGAIAGGYGYIFNKGGKVIRQGLYRITKHAASPNSRTKEHMHWGTDPKGRNGGAVNRDGKLRHGGKPPRKVIDLMVLKTGWDLSKLRSTQPVFMFEFQSRAADNLYLGLPVEHGNRELQ